MTPTPIPVIVLDDEPPLRRAARRQLERRGHEVLEAGTVPEARAILAKQPCALVLCDIDLPGESGLVLVQELVPRQPLVAVVMVTAVDDPAVAAVALDRGAYGYVVKPFEANELVISVENALRRRELEIAHAQTAAHLEALVALRTNQLRDSYEETLWRLASAAEYRDPETANHLERMSRYAEILARQAGLDEERTALVRAAAPMHDIGKIGISDEILLKPGRFDDHDRKIMQTHTLIGHRILEGSGSPLLQLAATVALTHHEWWDGSGYPYGLKGDAIPIEGRIVALADVFDALCSRRRYKDSHTMGEAFDMIVAESGTHFDPGLVALFTGAADEIARVHDQFSDHFADLPVEETVAIVRG